MNMEHGMMNMEVIFKLYKCVAFTPLAQGYEYLPPPGTGIKNRKSRSENRNGSFN